MDSVERIKLLATFGHTSYASYLREMTDGLPVGGSGGINLFGHRPHNARAALKQVARAQGRKYRTVLTGDHTMTVVRTQ